NAFTALAAIVRQLIAWSICHGIRWSTSPEYQLVPNELRPERLL
ncbi:hypothetical protein ACVW0P_002801, partial [Mucilaginibacter sp. UYNi724]